MFEEKGNPQTRPSKSQVAGEMDDILHHFALPNNLDDNTVVRLLQNNTTTYPLQYAGDELVNAWKEMKKEKGNRES